MQKPFPLGLMRHKKHQAASLRPVHASAPAVMGPLFLRSAAPTMRSSPHPVPPVARNVGTLAEV